MQAPQAVSNSVDLEQFAQFLGMIEPGKPAETETVLSSFSDTMHQLAMQWHKMGNTTKALDLEKKILKVLKSYLPLEHRFIANARNNKAIFLESLGHFKKAYSQLKKAHVVFEKSYPANSPEISQMLNNIGCCLRRLGRCRDALAAHEKAAEALAKTESLERAVALNNSANCLYGLGEYKKALERHQIAIDFLTHLQAAENPLYAATFNNRGTCLAALGRYKEALEETFKALKIWQAKHGETSLQVATALNNIGSILSSLQRHSKALDICQKAKEIRQTLLGKDHPLVALSASCVAACQRALEPLKPVLTEEMTPLVSRQAFQALIMHARDHLEKLPVESLVMAKNPTGFIRIHLPIPEQWKERLESLRLNYWAPGIAIETVEAVHNHPRYFESLIIEGGYRHNLYRETPKSASTLAYRVHRMFKGSDSERNIFSMGAIQLTHLGEVAVPEKTIVTFPKSLMHQVTLAKTGTLTLNCVFKGTEQLSCFDVFLPEQDPAEPIVERESVINKESNRIRQEIVALLNKNL